MTAPDVNADVRAKFEAWLLDREIKTPRRPNGYYQSDETCFWWRLWQDAYRAAHADRDEEVRELVEAADSSGEYLDAYFKASYSSQPADWMDAALLAKQWHCRIEAALAKFTHQEKP